MAKTPSPQTRTPARTARRRPAEVLFASADVDRIEARASLPAKFQRMLDRLPLRRLCAGGTVCLKMHIGGHLGYTTVPPLFVRLLVQKIKDAGAKRVFVTDGSLSIQDATARGYTAEVIGAPLVGAAGVNDKYFYTRKVGYKTLKELQLCGNVVDADVLVNFSHFKGHGDCGYGAACKNLAMGCVTSKSRGDLHQLEGGLAWDARLCIGCKKCVDACARGAARWDRGEKKLWIFFHDCVYCRHCMLVCPKGAIKITGGGFVPFQHGLALAAREVLRTFDPKRVLHINVLTQITMLCDCWGFSMRPLIPDVGILASQDIVAVEKASLDLTCDGDPLPGSLPRGRQLVEGRHLMERIHGKDPYVQIDRLEAVGLGTPNYRLREVK
jgi:hypothetical protein